MMESDNDKTQSHIALTKGAMVSHYRIVEKIGAGGMGEVYLAEDTKLKRQVALKFLPLHLCPDKDAKARFTREAQATAALKRPNVVTIHEVSEYLGRPFFAMEHVEGQSLRNLVKDGDVSITRVVELAIHICEGLREAHEAGIIHRDIKPSNIVIDKKGRPILLDFGLAAVEGGEQLTQTGSTLGTLGYMSPGQVRGDEPDARSDLFSLGVVLYEMITGTAPFKGENEAATLSAILEKTPEPLARYKSDVSDDLQRIVSKLLEKDRELRYQNAAGVVSDLKRLTVATGSSETVASVGSRTNRYLVGAFALLALVIIVAIGTRFFGPTPDEPATERKMLAVLPFENLGSPEDEYFADGITDEITSRLARLSGLGVISRTSAIQYKDTDKGLPQIAEELNVDFILEGTIRWDKAGDTDRVRITPQLIRVSDNIHLWAENYERPLTKIFAVQADIAAQIVEALDITLLEPERTSLADAPTDNPEAYDYYLRGQEYLQRSYQEEDCRIAIEMYQRALVIDSGFAVAHAALASAHLTLYWFTFDATQERLRLAKEAIDRALELDPDLPDAHWSLALYHYWGFRNYERALLEAEVARERQPNNDLVFDLIAAIKRRQGRWQEALANFKRSTEINPRYGLGFFEYGITQGVLRNYEEADSLLFIATSLIPNMTIAYIFRSGVHLAWNGDTEKARMVIETARGKVDEEPLAYPLAQCDVLDRDYESALGRFSSVVLQVLGQSVAGYYLDKAHIYSLLNDTLKAAACYDSARLHCEEQLTTDYAHLHWVEIILAEAHAGLGHKDEAITHCQNAVELLPISRDALDGPDVLLMYARVLVMVGEHDSALDKLEYLLSIPSILSVPLLRLDPQWDPLRDHPRFQALIEKYEKEHGT